MSLLYIGLGIVVLWNRETINLPKLYSISLGVLLIAYGTFRTYRIYQKYFGNGA